MSKRPVKSYAPRDPRPVVIGWAVAFLAGLASWAGILYALGVGR